MGRRPEPTHLKLVKGVTRRERVNRSEPAVPSGMPEKPARLTDATARSAWARFGRILLDMGVLTVADGAALERLCECYSQVCRLQRDLENHGHTCLSGVETDKDGRIIPGTGMVRARPEAALLADADRRLRGYLTDFGLTPSARGKIHAAGSAEKSKDPDAAFFG